MTTAPLLPCGNAGASLSLRMMLATSINSLALASRSRAQRRIVETHTTCTPRLDVTIQFQALFTCIFCMLFSFRSRYWCAIGLRVYLGLGVNTPGFMLASRRALLGGSARERTAVAYRAFTFCRSAFQRTSAGLPSLKAGPNTTSLLSSRRGFGLPSSVFTRVTGGISIDFFSSAY